MRGKKHIALLYAAVGGYALLRENAAARDWYTANALPALRSAPAYIFARTPVPVCEILLPLAIVGVAAAVALRKYAFPSALCSVLLALFVCLWVPLGFQKSNAPIPPDAKTLTAICTALSETAAADRAEVSEDENGRFRLTCSDEALAEYAKALTNARVAPKYARFPAIWSALGIAGWYSPFTGEAVVDRTLRDCALPFTMAHELQHAKGVVSEAEANWLAYTACRKGDAAFRYSGSLNALWYVMNKLKSCDPGAWAEVANAMDRSVWRDFRSINGCGEAKEGVAARIQDILTDVYVSIMQTESYDGFVARLAVACA